jgi:hypothetical protein
VLGHERLELAYQLGVAAQSEVGLDPVQQRRQPQLVQPLRFAGGKSLQTQIGECRAPPEREAVPQQHGRPLRPRTTRPRHKLLELMEVELPVLRPHQIARPLGHDSISAELLAQRRNVTLHQLGRPARRPLAPQLVDQPLARHSLVRVQEQHPQQAALLRRAEREQPTLLAGLQWPQYPELHPETHLPRDPLDRNTASTATRPPAPRLRAAHPLDRTQPELDRG